MYWSQKAFFIYLIPELFINKLHLSYRSWCLTHEIQVTSQIGYLAKITQ